MAIRKMNEGVSGWNNKTPFPKDRYTICCIEEDFAPSKSSGNPMLTRTWEIINPELVQIGDRQVNVAGAKIIQYRTTKVKSTKDEIEEGMGPWNEQSSDKAFGGFRDELLTLGFDSEGEIDDENPPVFAKGKTVDAIVYAKEDKARKSPTAEQIRKRQQGDPILDADGNEVVTYQLQLDTILGLASKQVGVAF